MASLLRDNNNGITLRTNTDPGHMAIQFFLNILDILLSIHREVLESASRRDILVPSRQSLVHRLQTEKTRIKKEIRFT